ncbi:MAG TPA: hypothetical protein VN612_00505 [Acidobacteriaceae bacterium]|nr:hypothetical protein [Acidobacteriaceae bacterium]
MSRALRVATAFATIVSAAYFVLGSFLFYGLFFDRSKPRLGWQDFGVATVLLSVLPVAVVGLRRYRLARNILIGLAVASVCLPFGMTNVGGDAVGMELSFSLFLFVPSLVAIAVILRLRAKKSAVAS